MRSYLKGVRVRVRGCVLGYVGVRACECVCVRTLVHACEREREMETAEYRTINITKKNSSINFNFIFCSDF